MKNFTLFICAVMVTMAGLAHAWSSYNYVSAKQLKGWLEADKPLLIVDIQVKNEFNAQHIKGSLETNAFPVKSEAERHLLDPALKQKTSKEYEAVVIVCPRGKGGAKRTYDYLNKQGIKEAKLHILTGGMAQWPYEEWGQAK